jgi:RND family efflux transporter MFP subunit
MGDDKAKLLHSLAIDRATAGTDAPPSGRRYWPALSALAVIASAAIGSAAWFLAPQLLGPGYADQVAGGETRPKMQAQAPLPASEARGSGFVASGYVVARRKAAIAAEITGKVVELLIDEGVVVEAGQVVARLDSVLAEADLALAKSRVIAAEAAANAITADLADAERIFARAQSLSKSHFVSEADLTKAEARVGVLRAQLAQAQSQWETARLDAQRNAAVLDKHSIRTPFAGVVVERSAQIGEMISTMSAGGSFTRTGICTVVDMDSIEVEVDVNEAFIGRVQAGGAVTAVLDAYSDWTIPASVIAIVPTANREKATVKVRIGFKVKDPRILPDMAVKVNFLDDGQPTGAASATKSSAAN